jgi:SH3-like domain-containing protein
VTRAFIALIIVGLAGFAEISCTPAETNREARAVVAGGGEASLSGCQPHIEVHGSAFWAKELGRPEMWVQQNHRINLRERPGSNRGVKTGELLVGSRAVILEEANEAYRVRSPLDGSTGWISAIQIARTLKQDVTTRQPC